PKRTSTSRRHGTSVICWAASRRSPPSPSEARSALTHRSTNETCTPPTFSPVSDRAHPTEPARADGNGHNVPMSSFTRMDESTAEQWSVIGAETLKNQPRVADEILSMLRRLEGVTDGFNT